MTYPALPEVQLCSMEAIQYIIQLRIVSLKQQWLLELSPSSPVIPIRDHRDLNPKPNPQTSSTESQPPPSLPTRTPHTLTARAHAFPALTTSSFTIMHATQPQPA
eukprot:2276023-Rhodomonas_salina.2